MLNPNRVAGSHRALLAKLENKKGQKKAKQKSLEKTYFSTFYCIFINKYFWEFSRQKCLKLYFKIFKRKIWPIFLKSLWRQKGKQKCADGAKKNFWRYIWVFLPHFTNLCLKMTFWLFFQKKARKKPNLTCRPNQIFAGQTEWKKARFLKSGLKKGQSATLVLSVNAVLPGFRDKEMPNYMPILL